MNWISVKFHQILMRRLQDNVVFVTGQNKNLGYFFFFLTQVNFQFPLFIFLALIIHELGLGDKGN